MVVEYLSISKTADRLHRLVRKINSVSGHSVGGNPLLMKVVCGIMASVVTYDRKRTGAQITTLYYKSIMKSISDCTTHRTFKQMGYNRRKPHRDTHCKKTNKKTPEKVVYS